MKICLKCHRGLFDSDIICDKCGCTDIIDKKEYDYLCDKFQQANEKQREKLRHSGEFRQICKYKFIVDNKNTPEMRKAQSKLDKEKNALKLEQIQQEYELLQDKCNKKRIEKQTNIPKCPTCGSTNIKHISTLNRAVSIGILGIFSGKIGKNYECLDCKARW